MRWEKLGKIFCPNSDKNWMYSHAMIPIAEHVTGNIYRVYYSSRDKKNRAQGAYLEIDITRPQRILKLSKIPVLSFGELGCFDDSGALPNCLIKAGPEKFLYYTGINLGVTVKIRNSIGIARWSAKKQIFERLFKGPIIDRNRDQPHFVATPDVHYENGIFKAWFTSCVRWQEIGDEVRHYYNIEYAESKNGLDWRREGRIAIDFIDEYEYALGVPRVIKDGSVYKMWFCSRATKDVKTYRMRYAESCDGIKWTRKDDEVGIDVSKTGWDSEMICYPFVFEHTGKRFMLYNGNGYGKTGFGIAILNDSV